MIESKNQIIKFQFQFFDLLRSIHPSSRRVSEQLTKITGSSSLHNQMLIILFSVWAGIKYRESKNQNI